MVNMDRTLVALALLGALGGMGCATSLNDSAPAANGQILAVGSHNNVAAAWLCPATPGPCKAIDVKEQNK
jgi:hypothetical protein